MSTKLAFSLTGLFVHIQFISSVSPTLLPHSAEDDLWHRKKWKNSNKRFQLEQLCSLSCHQSVKTAGQSAFHSAGQWPVTHTLGWQHFLFCYVLQIRTVWLLSVQLSDDGTVQEGAILFHSLRMLIHEVAVWGGKAHSPLVTGQPARAPPPASVPKLKCPWVRLWTQGWSPAIGDEEAQCMPNYWSQVWVGEVGGLRQDRRPASNQICGS